MIRLYNDQLRNVERAFLDACGRDRNGYEHMVHGPSLVNPNLGILFPTLTEAIYNYNKNADSKDLLEQIKFSLYIVIYSLQSAISMLKEPFDFTRA